jgi:hypothetical protein
MPNGIPRRRTFATLVVATAVLALPATAAAARHQRAHTRSARATVRHNPRGRFLGVIPARPPGTPVPQVATALSYHNGPVMHSSRVYAIFWQPAGRYLSPSYRSLITTMLSDVALDSYRTQNGYSVMEQYYDKATSTAPKSFIEYNVGYGGSFLDTSAFPANGCTDAVTTVCLTDAQLTSHLNSFITAHGLGRGLATEYFLFTPPNVGSCFDAASTSCAYTEYCAYHSSFGTGAGTTIYANQPYLGNVSGCDQGHYPNGNFGDATLSAVAHEHRESITDPLGTAWWDSGTGDEADDKCNQTFGTMLGSTGATDDPNGFPFGDSAYNQVVHSDFYALQEEFSNRGLVCRQKNDNAVPSGINFTTSANPTHGVATTFTATASDANGIYQYKWYWGDGTNSVTTSPTVTHTYATAGSKSVSLVVFDTVGSNTRLIKAVAVG